MENSGFWWHLPAAIILVLIELAYFKIAMTFGILDKPNLRSSHYIPVVRGGGIIFVAAVWLWFFMYGFQWGAFVAGITAASIISFMDDIRSQSRRLRFIIHLLAILLLFYSAGVFAWPFWLIALSVVVCIGTLNAFNFMDGINGITGVYALVTLVTFAYIERHLTSFTSLALIHASLLSVCVFLIYNFRKKAICFAGDVGSVSIAFVLIFLLLQLIVKTDSMYWVMLFLVYGIDSVVTIIYRLLKRENIFEPHRKHLYQYLSNEMKWEHRTVAVLYGAVQLAVNVTVFLALDAKKSFVAIGVGVAVLICYIVIRERVSRMIRLNAVNK